VTEFCRRRGLHSSYLFVWKKRLRETPAARFLEVKVTERASISSDSRIEVRLQNGRSLVVERGFDADHLRALLAVVEPGI
jgi:transposase-like protein